MAVVASTSKTAILTIKAIIEITIPAMARPFVLLPINPITEQIIPIGNKKMLDQNRPTRDEIKPIRIHTSDHLKLFLGGATYGVDG